MKTNVEVSGARMRRSATSRSRARRNPLCEVLEGRQLLHDGGRRVVRRAALGFMERLVEGLDDSGDRALQRREQPQRHGTWSADATHTGESGSFTPKAWSRGDAAGSHHVAK